MDWVDDPDSSVDVYTTAVADLKGVARVGRSLLSSSVPIADVRRTVGRHPLPAACAPTDLGTFPTAA